MPAHDPAETATRPQADVEVPDWVACFDQHGRPIGICPTAALTPVSNPGQAFLEPAIGVDAYRDAAAAIRCLAADDGEGLHAVLAGTDAPRHVAGALASIAYLICRRGGLDAAGIDQLLGEISGSAADAILDQPRPRAGKGVA
ncbi:hypothetical protein [Kitasatospora acidiphila]|uniref:hypothetical protein n=1 Tax=Kitasatospora acidiphila TaxID=2567942 RepID=UPI003C7318F5